MSRNAEYWMRQALTLAEQGAAAGEVPVGAIIVLDDEVIGTGWNQPITSADPTAHAEVVALRAAARQLHNYRLPESTLYVTIEPCTMCAGALIHARVKRVVFGALEPRAGAVCSHFRLFDTEGIYNHRVEWEQGVLAEECANVISGFFRAKRRGLGTTLDSRMRGNDDGLHDPDLG
jgi:tRNA(adenine34) deaminase